MKPDEMGNIYLKPDDIPWHNFGEALKKMELNVDEAGTKKRILDKTEFMYMHTRPGSAWTGEICAFKHHMTRNYVYLVDRANIVVRYNAHFNRGYFGEAPDHQVVNVPAEAKAVIFKANTVFGSTESKASDLSEWAHEHDTRGE